MRSRSKYAARYSTGIFKAIGTLFYGCMKTDVEIATNSADTVASSHINRYRLMSRDDPPEE
jgi:hypothetical protein